jgi:hypothetical protein
MSDEIERRFGFHPATPEVVETYRAIRAAFKALAVEVSGLTPQSREASLFLTSLQEAQMWAIASVATNLTPVGAEGSGAR